MVSLASTPLYAIRPEATKSSKVLTELRSELRSEQPAYDYQEIRDANIRTLVSERENEIKKVLKRDFKFLFSGFRLDTLSKPAAAAVSFFLQKAFFDELLKKASLLHNNSSVTIPVIKEDPELAGQIDFVNLKAHPWLKNLQVKPSRTPLKAMVFFYEPKNIPFHTIQFEGQSYKAPVRVPLWTFPDGVLAINAAYLIANPSIVFQELEAVLWFPQVLFHWNLEPSQAEIRTQPRQAYTYEDIRDLKIQNVARDQEWEIQRVLSSGLTSILSREFRFTAPHELQNAVDNAIWEQLPTEEGLQEIQKLLQANKSRKIYLRKMVKVREVLKADWEVLARDIARFKLYFSGFSFDSQSDHQIRMGVSAFLEVLGAHEFFKARAVQVKNRITIPLMKDTPQELAYDGKTVDFENLWRERERVPLSSILFYAESEGSSNFPFEQVQLAGKLYTFPKGVPLWTFPDGVLALNVTRASEDVASVYHALGMALSRYELPRSELRKVSSQSIVHRPQAITSTADRGLNAVDYSSRRSIQAPDIPDVENGKVLSGRSAFGIQAQDAFVIDLKLIRTQYDLAVLFAVFNHFPFVLLGDDADTPIVKTIQAMNTKLPPSERVVLALSAEESLQLLQQKIADQMRRASAYPKTFTQTRLILSDQTSLDAAALQKQLGDHVVVQTTTLDQFSQTAFGVANRLELADFAAELHQKVLSQLLTAESA